MPERGGDEKDRMLVFVGELGISVNGSNVRRVNLEKIPRFGSH